MAARAKQVEGPDGGTILSGIVGCTPTGEQMNALFLIWPCSRMAWERFPSSETVTETKEQRTTTVVANQIPNEFI